MTTQKDRIESAIRHIQTATDVDPWAMELAVEAMKIQDKLLETLNGFGSDLPCDESPDSDWCAEHCQYSEPQNECWIRWAKGVLGLPLGNEVQNE